MQHGGGLSVLHPEKRPGTAQTGGSVLHTQGRFASDPLRIVEARGQVRDQLQPPPALNPTDPKEKNQ